MAAATDLTAVLTAARAVSSRALTALDEELLADAGAVEAIGRLVDGWRLAVAAQLESRSAPGLGEDRLSFREGTHDGVELVQRVARISHVEARRRVGLGSALAPQLALDGSTVPARLYGELAEAVATGAVGIDSARVIVNAVQSIRSRVMTPGLRFLITELTREAAEEDTERLREDAALLASALDPDGAEPKDRAQRRKRGLRFGRLREDGMTRFGGFAGPEDAAVLKAYFQSRRRGLPLARTVPGGDESESLEPEWREKDGPAFGPDLGQPRSRAQQDLDTLMEAIRAAMAAEQEGAGGTTVTHEVVVTVTAEELEARRGQGWTPGVLAGIAIPDVDRLICSGGVRLAVLGDQGEPLYLSRSHRLFSAAQKKALLTAAGGRCQYPGCRTPSPYLHAHHVEWYQRDDGETHVDNGVMLCNHHHHLIHANRSPVEIRRHEGAFFFVPRWWTGPPDPLQRAGRGLFDDPRLRDLLRRHDPDTSPWAA